MDSTTRAVCASLSRIEGSVMDQLLSIRDGLIASDVVGSARVALLFTSGWFVLWIEGDDAAVDAALKRAADDPRNQHQKLLHRSRGPAWLRERVVVATTHSPMQPTHFARWVMHMKSVGASHEPSEIWNRLGAPCLVDRARHPCTAPQQRFAIVAADDHGPVDELRKLGERVGSPVVYQRFGTARRQSPDLGMAYVDVPTDEGAARVRVLSRRALAQPSVRRMVQSLDGLALVLGTRPAVAIELATNIAESLKDSAHPPVVRVIGDSGAPAAACVRLIEGCGVDAAALAAPASGGLDLWQVLPALGLQPQGISVPVHAIRMDGRMQPASLASNL